jgi:pimeloyl-ACP methyl ester carboxylesterase
MGMTALKWVLSGALALYVGTCAFLYAVQRDWLYPVPQTVRTSPVAAGFPAAEEMVLDTADGEKVIVWHVPPQQGKPLILFLHGNGDFLAGRVSRFRAITEDGTGLLALSYRGYAGSTGHPTETGLLLDAATAYDYASARYAPQRIVIWGFSLGTGPAVALAAEHQIGKLILEAPYTSTADVASSRFPLVPVRVLMKDQFRSDERIGKVTAPLLVMHGEHDPAIAIRFGERLFALAHEPKRFVRFPQGGHENLDDHGAIKVVQRFIYDDRPAQ